jgi:hypothetical protein
MVVKTQTGPKALYAKPQPLDFTNLASAGVEADSSLLSIALSVQDANLVVSALDTVSRLGIGQWTVLAEEFRWNTFLATKEVDFEAIDKAMTVLKYEALGFAGGGNWGIFSPSIHPTVTSIWGMQKAIRHRLAWDRNPEGGMGVYFDEPMASEVLRDFTVTSLVQGGVTSICLTTTAPRLMALMAALAKYGEIAKGCLSVLLDARDTGLCPQTRQGHNVIASNLVQALRQAQVAIGLSSHSDELVLSPSSQRIAAIERALSPVPRGRALSEGAVTAVAFPEIVEMPIVGSTERPLRGLPASCVRVTGASFANKLGALNTVLETVPRGFSVGFERGAYQVLKVDESDNSIVIIGSSHSLQTALCMVKNAAAPRPLRSHSF